MDPRTTTEAKEKDTPTTTSTDESLETTSESVKEYRRELKEALESKPSSSECPTPKSLNPDPEVKVRDASSPSAETEVREDAREHEPMREDARGERHESVDRDDTKHEDGSVGEPEEWKQAVDFAKELASEGKLEWFRTMMARIESGRVDVRKDEDRESRITESKRSKGKKHDLGEFKFGEPGPPSSPPTSSTSSHTSRSTKTKRSTTSKGASAASTTSKLSRATEIQGSLSKMFEEQKKISRRLDELEESGKSRIESDLNTSALSKVTGLHVLDEHQKGISPFFPRIKESYLPEEFAVRIKVGTLQEARDQNGLTALALLAVSSSKVDDSDLDDSKDSGSGTKGTAKGKPEIPLPVFTGKRLDLYARDFVRYLRMTGQKAADEMTRADLIVTGCKNEWLRGVVDDILTTSESWVHFLKQLESAFPHFETDASIRGALEKVQKLKELPTPADVLQLLQKLKSLMIQLKIPMSETEKLLLLTRKIQKKTWTECRSTAERKAKTHTYQDLADLLEEIALGRSSDHHVEGEREAQLNFLKGANKNKDPNQEPLPEAGQDEEIQDLYWSEGQKGNGGKGKGKGRGKGSGRGGGRGEQGKWVWQPPQFHSIVWCEYCGKKNHARDECWTKQADERKARAAAKKQGEDPGKGKGKSDGKAEGKGDRKGKGNGEKGGKGGSGKGQPSQTTPPPNAIPLPEAAEGEEGQSNRKRRRFLKLQENFTNMAKSCVLALTMDAKPLPPQDK